MRRIIRSPITRRFLVVLCLPASAAIAQVMNAGGTRPAISPSGRLIAFSAARDGTWDVYLAMADGSGERRLTRIAEKNFVNLGPPTWIGDAVLVMHRVDDTTRLTLLDMTGRQVAASVQPSVPIDATQIRPSPDGKRFVFLHRTRGRPVVAIANFDGTKLRDLTDASTTVLNPDWSRDGRRIAFTTVDSAGAGQIAVFDIERGESRVITRFDAANGLPQWASWSPDGTHLFIQAGKYSRTNVAESTSHLWLVDVETGAASKVAPHEATYLDETPSWFPVGSRIAFQSNRTGLLQVWTMKPDGTDARQVTSWHP